MQTLLVFCLIFWRFGTKIFTMSAGTVRKSHLIGIQYHPMHTHQMIPWCLSTSFVCWITLTVTFVEPHFGHFILVPPSWTTSTTIVKSDSLANSWELNMAPLSTPSLYCLHSCAHLHCRTSRGINYTRMDGFVKSPVATPDERLDSRYRSEKKRNLVGREHVSSAHRRSAATRSWILAWRASIE